MSVNQPKQAINTAISEETGGQIQTARPWVVYILQCSDGSLYTGIANNLDRRIRQHNGELSGGAKYTRGRRPVSCVWVRPLATKALALRYEIAIKRLSKAKKMALINGVD